MSRSGYSDYGDCENWSNIRWRGAVASSIRGRRGQAFLRELLSALDAMPEKRLITHELRVGGEVCALGSVGAARNADMSQVDPEDHDSIAGLFGIPHALACEIMWENDDAGPWGGETPEARWARVRGWAVANIRDEQ